MLKIGTDLPAPVQPGATFSVYFDFQPRTIGTSYQLCDVLRFHAQPLILPKLRNTSNFLVFLCTHLVLHKCNANMQVTIATGFKLIGMALFWYFMASDLWRIIGKGQFQRGGEQKCPGILNSNLGFAS